MIPPEVARALHRQRREGVDRHQAIRSIAAELFEAMFPTFNKLLSRPNAL